MFCKHQWKILSKEVLPSPYEQCMDRLVRNKSSTPLFFQKKLVQIVVCENCGEIKQFSEKLFEEDD